MNPLKMSIGKRRQLFEIQDFTWCPKAVRDGVTDLLVINLRIVPVYEPAIPVLSKLARMTDGKWIDLCAGAGGGSLFLKEKMPGEIKELILTDLYPHKTHKMLPEGVVNFPEPVNAVSVPASLKGFRTLFTSFHHLPDDIAKGVLENARDSKTPIAIFEFTDRSLFCLLMVLPTFIFSFFLIPLVLPWKLSRFFWTFIIPLIPLVAGIDIVMSCFRTRNVKELDHMIEPLRSDNYEWKTGKLPTYLGLTLTYVVGQPR
jgi:hypothetical protein